MFQLPSFFKIRMVALVIGFFMLFWLIGFAKWCFASTVSVGCYHHAYWQRAAGTGDMSWGQTQYDSVACDNTETTTFSGSNVQRTVKEDEYSALCTAGGWTEFSTNSTGLSIMPSRGVSGSAAKYTQANGSPHLAGNELERNNILIAAFPECPPPPEQCAAATTADKIEACGSVERYVGQNPMPSCTIICEPCLPADRAVQVEKCGGEEQLEFWRQDYCEGYCKNCNEITPATGTGPCPDGENLDFHCNVVATDTFSGNPAHVEPVELDIGLSCVSCESKESVWAAANCPAGPGYEVTSYDCVADTGTCEDCYQKKTDWTNANCPAGPGYEVTSYDCVSNTGTCEDCYQKQKRWEMSNCYGPGLYTESYNCLSNVGVCKDCGLVKQTYENEKCKPFGKILIAFDCEVGTGICGDDLCSEDRKQWETLYCSGPGQSLVNFDCAAKTGVCRDENDCSSKETAWETQHCKPLNLTLKSYDCLTDTGECNDPYGCEERQSLWESKFCQGPGLTLKSYDCVSDSGVCEDTSDCLISENNWIANYCSEKNDVFISYDCSSGHGQCQHGSDFSYDPTDEEKSKFTDRYNQFISDMRQTPLFSLPDQVLGNIPSGGSPVYTVEMGQYGSSDVDLSNYSSVFAIVRTVFLVCFSFAALRILISKR